MHKPDARVYADTKSWLVPNYFVVGIVNPAGALHKSRKGSGSPGFGVAAKCNAASKGAYWVTGLVGKHKKYLLHRKGLIQISSA